MTAKSHSVTQRIVEVFLRGNLSVLLIVVSMLCGAAALLATPREEEPQIVVPLADVLIQVPGASAREVEKHVSTRLEKMLMQIDGVEYVYSMSSPGRSIVTVRFYVGENREDSLVKIYNKIQANIDQAPISVAGWVVKPVEIDDVPIVNVTLWSDRPDLYDDAALRRLAEEVETDLQSVKNTNKVSVIGGRPRVVRVEFDPEAMAAHGVAPSDVVYALRASDAEAQAGEFDQQNASWRVEAGRWIRNVDEVRDLVIGVTGGRPVYLKNVANVLDGPDETNSYTWFGFGPAAEDAPMTASFLYPAVHVAVAKKRGTNAVWVARAVEKRVADLEKTVLPQGVHARTTRNYGETANDKVNELVEGLVAATLIVIGLIALSLGWKEALVVVVAVPITFSLTLLVNLLLGYTINRVTLFALILALGLVVDDPIVDVENIYRHFKMRKEPFFKATLTAVNEVRPPIILATLAVIVSFIPLFFITGMMGPYMAPMALNVPVSMLMSLVVAFTITPWMSYHVMKPRGKKAQGASASQEDKASRLEQTLTYRVYARLLDFFLSSDRKAVALLAGTCFLLFAAMMLGALRLVPLKMLPFDNKNEFQIVVDMPEGTTLETTDAALRALASELRAAPEVVDFSLYSGLTSAMDFNGLVRHYYLRQGAHVGDIRVNLVHKKDRAQQSHEIALRLRNRLDEASRPFGANVKVVEMPPGPPVISTIVAEITAEPGRSYADLIAAAKVVRSRLEREPLVVDVDDTVEADQSKWIFETDKEKAALSGVSTRDIADAVSMALSGISPAIVHLDTETHPLRIVLRMPRSERSAIKDLQSLAIKGASGNIVPLSAMGSWTETTEEKTIYHKNLERIAYVLAEVAGRAPAEAIIDIQADRGRTRPDAPRPLGRRTFLWNGGGIGWDLPDGTRVNWAGEGEWKITLDVFRDLGLAFAAACLGIYMLLVYQTGSYFMPLILMISIPLTILGIMPGFWILNWIGNHPVGGYPNPTFFTATAMIGMIALAGIAVRNAILLIEFVHDALRCGDNLETALLHSGAVRFRPIVLTAGAAMLAAWPITLDPIFSGLAWALIFGLFVSTAFTLLIIPVVYYLVYRNRPGHGLAPETLDE
ncbi:efflux RND transporter permease subunit [Candidatus Sumerlaeota bacterium]|nr:efflux RND transporter permease subunit [Candidatus Sumerlaeota bacterium]